MLKPKKEIFDMEAINPGFESKPRKISNGFEISKKYMIQFSNIESICLIITSIILLFIMIMWYLNLKNEKDEQYYKDSTDPKRTNKNINILEVKQFMKEGMIKDSIIKLENKNFSSFISNLSQEN